jgi:hypothetical protein
VVHPGRDCLVGSGKKRRARRVRRRREANQAQHASPDPAPQRSASAVRARASPGAERAEHRVRRARVHCGASSRSLVSFEKGRAARAVGGRARVHRKKPVSVSRLRLASRGLTGAARIAFRARVNRTVTAKAFQESLGAQPKSLFGRAKTRSERSELRVKSRSSSRFVTQLHHPMSLHFRSLRFFSRCDRQPSGPALSRRKIPSPA